MPALMKSSTHTCCRSTRSTSRRRRRRCTWPSPSAQSRGIASTRERARSCAPVTSPAGSAARSRTCATWWSASRWGRVGRAGPVHEGPEKPRRLGRALDDQVAEVEEVRWHFSRSNPYRQMRYGLNARHLEDRPIVPTVPEAYKSAWCGALHQRIQIVPLRGLRRMHLDHLAPKAAIEVGFAQEWKQQLQHIFTAYRGVLKMDG